MDANRCAWATVSVADLAYHDTEWGFPHADERHLFEQLSLEAFQSGLSWRTILAKREGFRRAFADFDIHAIAGYSPADVERLLADPSIVRHRGKIEATITNARRALEVGSLAALLWRHEPADNPGPRSTSPESVALAKWLKRDGWRFVGPTTVHSWMQAAGVINDHDPACEVHPLVEAARASFDRPLPLDDESPRP